MRVATYNVEWFASLFSKDNRLLIDDHWSGRHNVTRAQQTEALAKVFTAIDADAILIVEAPNTGHKQSSETALENFAKAFDLRTNCALGGFANDTHQEITLLYDPAVVTTRHDPIGAPNGTDDVFSAPRFDSSFQLDLDVDAVTETIEFSKPPLEAELVVNNHPPIRMIGVHAKSKVPHGAKSPQEEVLISIANRRKQMAQCVWIRRRVVEHLEAGEPVIVLGDFNDGPGLDEYENLFGHSSVEVVLGCEGPDERMLYDPHAMAAMKPRGSGRYATSRFFLNESGTYLNAFLDYIMVSPDLRQKSNRWTIWHPFDNPDCFANSELQQALLLASDHFPVTLDIDL